VILEQMELKAFKASKVCRDLLVLMARLVQQEHKDLREFRDRLEQTVYRVQSDLRDLKAPLVQRELMEQLDLRDLRDRLV
jgi:hypothetical protein